MNYFLSGEIKNIANAIQNIDDLGRQLCDKKEHPEDFNYRTVHLDTGTVIEEIGYNLQELNC